MQRLWPIFMKMAEVASYPNMNPEQQRIYMDSLNNYRTVMAAKKSIPAETIVWVKK